MLIKDIDDKTLDEFVYNSSKAHFMQTSAWGDVNKKRNYLIHKIGFYDGEELKATALLLEKKILNYSTFYCPRGPILDYDNKELLKEVMNDLKEFSSKHNGLYLRVNPDIVIRKLDEKANIKEVYEDKFELIDYLKSLGLKHRGFTKKFNESSAPRYTFRIDVDKTDEELLSSFHNTTKKILKRNNPFKLELYKGDHEDIKDFYNTMKETSLRKKMYVEPIEYFENFYDLLNNKGMSDIYLVKADIDTIKKIYEERITELEFEKDRVNKLTDKKKQTQLNEIHNKEVKLHKELAILNETKEKELVLSSVITAKFKDMVWLIHGGNLDSLQFLNANYELYYGIIKDAMSNGYKIVDFYGSEGEIDEKSPAYGIYLFKLRFGGDFIEFIGEFDIITKPLMNTLIQKALYLRRRYLIKKSLKDADLAQG